MGRWRQVGAPAGIVFAAMLLIAGVVVVARSTPIAQPAIPSLRDPDYSRDATGRVARLRTDFVAQALGSATLDQLTGGAARDGARTAAAPNPPARPTTSPSAAHAAASSSPPVDHSFLANTFNGSGWNLRLEFAADQARIAPGHDITYTLTARNVGRDPFVGRIDLRSHVPLYTSYVTDPVCAIKSMLANASAAPDACPLPGLPVPADQQDRELFGQPVPLTALTWTVETTIPPGGTLVRRFHVTVSPTPPNSQIVNHAHINVLGSPAQRSGDVVVPVDNVVPQ